MPDKNGVLSADEKTQAVVWLNNQGVSAKCPRCNPGVMTLLDFIVKLPAYLNGPIPFGGSEVPNLALICGNCGYTSLHNAVLAGVVEKQKREIGEGDD